MWFVPTFLFEKLATMNYNEFYEFYFVIVYNFYCCSHACLFIFSLNVLYCFYFIHFIYLFL